MLSIFPELFTYTLFAPLILRITVGAYFIMVGLRRHKEDAPAWNSLWNDFRFHNVPVAPVLAKLQVAIGAFIFVGLFTQVAVIVAIAFMWAEWFKRNRTARLGLHEMWILIFLSVICVSLLLLGAGLMAFDLPL